MEGGRGGGGGGGGAGGWEGGGGVSVQCVEIGRPELVGGKASKAGAQPPHSHQLRGMWRQRTRASSAAPQPRSPGVSVSPATESSFPKASQTSCISAQLPVETPLQISRAIGAGYKVQDHTGS